MFITFEGPDGSGKSTQAKMLAENLKAKGHDVELVHFPRYESAIGKLIGEILHGEVTVNNFDALEMLYVADQLDYQKELEDLIYNQHKIVIADRYDMSTVAYYSSKTGISIDDSLELIKRKWQYGFKQPDMTFLISFSGDLDDRRKNLNKAKDILENDSNIIESINNVYLELSEKLYTRDITIVDGSNSQDKNSNMIYKEVSKSLDELKKYKFSDFFKPEKNQVIEPF